MRNFLSILTPRQKSVAWWNSLSMAARKECVSFRYPGKIVPDMSSDQILHMYSLAEETIDESLQNWWNSLSSSELDELSQYEFETRNSWGSVRIDFKKYPEPSNDQLLYLRELSFRYSEHRTHQQSLANRNSSGSYSYSYEDIDIARFMKRLETVSADDKLKLLGILLESIEPEVLKGKSIDAFMPEEYEYDEVMMYYSESGQADEDEVIERNLNIRLSF